MKITFFLILLIFVVNKISFSCTNGVQAGSNPSVTTICGSTYSSHAVVSPENFLPVYDLYYLTSDGLNNNNADIVWMRGGGYTAQNVDLGDGASSTFVPLAQKHFNVYAVSYSWMGMAIVNGAIDASVTAFNIFSLSGTFNYWPSTSSVGYNILIDSETMTILTSTGTTINQSVTVTRGVNGSQQNPHSNADNIYIPSTVLPLQPKEAACFQAFLGHNSGVNGVPGNPMDIRSWSYSAGTHLSSMNAFLGSVLIDTNVCEYSVNDYAKTHITKLLLSGYLGDLGCGRHFQTAGVDQNYFTFINGGPMTATFSGNSCVVTSPNSYYLIGDGQSPNYCLPAQIQTGCAFPLKSDLGMIVRTQTAGLDDTVSPWAGAQLLINLPGSTEHLLPSSTHASILSDSIADGDTYQFLGQGLEVPSTNIQGKVSLIGQTQGF